VLTLIGIGLIFIASVIALVSYKVEYWPWELHWLEDGVVSSPIWLIIIENIKEVAALGISALLLALYAAIGFRKPTVEEINFNSQYGTIVFADHANDTEKTEQGDEFINEVQAAVAQSASLTDGEQEAKPVVARCDNQLSIALAEVARLKRDLVLSRRETETAEKARAQFLSNMSHELRTPMNGIMGMSELLNECDLPSKEKHFATSINASSESLLNIINDLLDYSRMEAGDMRLEQARFDLGACAEEVCAVLATQAQSKGIELICYVDDELPKYVKGDAARLRQILNNLIGNAIAFTHEGEIVVRLSKAESSKQQVAFKCDVQDTGAGIAPELQARLFESFNQADQSNTRQHGGLGMGLAITNELVSLMGGELVFRSRLGEGTRFTFTGEFERIADEDEGKINVGNFGGASVLIVDDNATNRSILQHQVAGWGMEPELAESGEQALEIMNAAAANNKLFDALILDLHMPGMDGIELARAIRNTPAIASTKAMMLTSAIVDLSEVEMAELEIHTYISKPARQSQLRECLRDTIFTDTKQSGVNATNAKYKSMSGANDAQLKQIAREFPTSVLLAEDDAVNVDVASAMLDGLNCTTTIVRDGNAAVDIAQAQAFDIIFMDCEMPGLSGFDAARKIKQASGPNANTPVVALTANSMPGDRERCLDAGMQDYISKPMRQQQIAKALIEWAKPVNTNNIVNLRQPDINLDAVEKGAFNEAVESATSEHVDTADSVSSSALNTEATPSSSQVINLHAIEKIKELQRPGKPDILSKVLNMYFDKTPEQIEQLQKAVVESDFDEARTVAHGMKSSSAYLGAEKLAALCGEVESSVREGNTDNMTGLADSIFEEYCEAEAELKQLIDAA